MLDVDLRRKKSNIAQESELNEKGWYVSLRGGQIDKIIKFEQNERQINIHTVWVAVVLISEIEKTDTDHYRPHVTTGC